MKLRISNYKIRILLIYNKKCIFCCILFVVQYNITNEYQSDIAVNISLEVVYPLQLNAFWYWQAVTWILQSGSWEFCFVLGWWYVWLSVWWLIVLMGVWWLSILLCKCCQNTWIWVMTTVFHIHVKLFVICHLSKRCNVWTWEGFVQETHIWQSINASVLI
jgi:hypothetical protein